MTHDNAARAANGASQVLDALLRIEALLESLPQRIEQVVRKAPIHDRDAAVLAALIPAIAESPLREIVFTAAELIEHMEQRCPDEMSRVQKLLGGGNTGRRLGKMISRIERTPVDGWHFERRGTQNGVTLWRVISNPTKPRKSS